MIPIVASLLGTLAQNGLGLLSSAIQAKGKEVVEQTLGVKIADNPSPEEVSKLRQLQFEHEERLLRANNGQDASSGVTTSTAGSGSITSGVVGVALDMDAKTATIYAGNVVRLNVSAIPAGTYFPFFRADSGTDQFVLNAGQQPFFYTPPSGYVALNTYNL